MEGDIFGWLSATEGRNGSAYALLELSEAVPFDDAIKARIVQALTDARVNEVVQNRLRARLTKQKYEKLMAAAQPVRPVTRKGDFGELIAALSLSTHLGLLVPVKKLRYKLRSSDQPTNIDVVGLRFDADANRITDVCYAESKLRTITDARFGEQAHLQLKNTWLGALPELHLFIANVLADRNDPLFDPFLDYMADDERTSSFCIALHSDEAAWSPDTLDNLTKAAPLLEPLTVLVSKIDALGERVKDCFDAAGLMLDETDD